MAGPPTSAFGQMTAIYSGSSVPEGAVTTLGGTWVTSDSDRASLAQIFADALVGWASASTSVDEVVFKQGPSASGPSFSYPVTATGANLDVSVPPQVAVLVRKNVADLSTRFAGRMYLPGLPENTVNAGGVIDGSYVSGIQTEMDDFFAAAIVLGWESRVFSAASSDPRTVTSLTVQSRIATQRLRNRR